MTANQFKLNDDKTELVMFTPKRMQSKIKDKHIQIPNANIQSAQCARNLAFFLEKKN